MAFPAWQDSWIWRARRQLDSLYGLDSHNGAAWQGPTRSSSGAFPIHGLVAAALLRLTRAIWLASCVIGDQGRLAPIFGHVYIRCQSLDARSCGRASRIDGPLAVARRVVLKSTNP